MPSDRLMLAALAQVSIDALSKPGDWIVNQPEGQLHLFAPADFATNYDLA
ncbi:hypothetical protein SAMN02990966_07925 [Rhodospirillales bacterium URHD0017]|nr:hypothetical protein SAMN02990966_07925 [Rhodospirillales bacterium URHD0017]